MGDALDSKTINCRGVRPPGVFESPQLWGRRKNHVITKERSGPGDQHETVFMQANTLV